VLDNETICKGAQLLYTYVHLLLRSRELIHWDEVISVCVTVEFEFK